MKLRASVINISIAIHYSVDTLAGTLKHCMHECNDMIIQLRMNYIHKL